MSLIPLRRNNQEWDHDNNPYTFDNPNIYMRPATEDDVDNMYDWEMESIDSSLQQDPKVQKLIRDDCYQSIKDTQMIMDQDKTIGMFTACMIDNGEWRYIGEIYLIPEYRGQHIGSTILKNEIEKYDRIRLQVAFDNEPALRLYQSLGFKIVSENKKGGLYIMEKDDVTPEPVNEAFFKEAYIKAKDRNKLPDSKFGIPELRKFPLVDKNGKYDENHIRMAVKYFGDAPEKYKKTLAERILRAAHSIGLDTENWDSINNALKKKESSNDTKAKLKQEAAVSGGAYTSKGINWANVQPVTMVYKRFSTKNREQMEPIKRFWEISDKYFPEPSMTSGFGWDWTGWETDFAYGIIINDKKVPPEFMEELTQEFPDIILDENFLIPINYEEVYECSFEEMDATYDKIWSKGFLECEYEQYPALGRMKISVIYKKDADKLNSEISKYIKTVPTVKGYRFTLQDKNVGIYEELKRIMYNETNSPDTWEAFKKSPACSWLPSPPSYGENNKSYFTKLGYDKFMSDTWPVLTKYINDDTIDCEEVDIPVSDIVYQDDYQFITGSPLQESNTERKNLIMKEQVTKILEAYNSGVITQKEAVEKIVQEEYLAPGEKYPWDNLAKEFKNLLYARDAAANRGENTSRYEEKIIEHKGWIQKYIDKYNKEHGTNITLDAALHKGHGIDVTDGSPRELIDHTNATKGLEKYDESAKISSINNILEAFNNGVLTQEEVVEKIEAIQEEYRASNPAEQKKIEEMKENWDEKYFKEIEKIATDPDAAKKRSSGVQRGYEAFYNELKKYRPSDIKEAYVMNQLREKQEKIMESFKMGIINGVEGMRLIERVLMESDYMTEDGDDAADDLGGDDTTMETPDVPEIGGDDDSSYDSNIESLADYINSLDASERADLLAKINTDVATAGDADTSDDIENNDDADDLTPPDGETEEPTADGDTDAEPEVETESAKVTKEPDERLINAYKNVSLDDMEV